MLGIFRRLGLFQRLNAGSVMRATEMPAQPPPGGSHGDNNCTQGKHQNRK